MLLKTEIDSMVAFNVQNFPQLFQQLTCCHIASPVFKNMTKVNKVKHQPKIVALYSQQQAVALMDRGDARELFLESV